MAIVTDSYRPLAAAQLDEHRAIGLVAYIGHVPNAITKPEVDALLKAGKAVALIIEHTYNDWVGGYERGLVLGAEARASARALGFPDTRPVGLAIDDNLRPDQIAAALRHLAGFHAAAGLSWVYGTALLIDRAFEAGLVTHGMQSCSTGFYDNARVSAHAALHQHCHPSVDTNDVLLADWGQLPAPNVVHVPRPTPGHGVAQEDTMIALIQRTTPKENEQPYLTIGEHGTTIVAVFADAAFAEAKKVTNGFGVSVFHLEPHETAVALLRRTDTSVLVVLADHTTRTLRLASKYTV